MIEVLFTKLDERAIPPTQAYPGDAGWDLHALEDVHIHPNRMLTWVRTGIAIAIPEGHYGRIVGRSSAASKGFHVVEGVMDSGYRGEQLMRVVSLWSPELNSPTPWDVAVGDSLAQLIVSPIPAVTMRWVEELPESVRGTNGFGSSGR